MRQGRLNVATWVTVDARFGAGLCSPGLTCHARWAGRRAGRAGHHVGRLKHVRPFRILTHPVAQSRVESRHQLECLRDFLLHPQADLKPKLFAELRNSRLPFLRHQHKDGEEDGLEGNDRRHQREGEWIDLPTAEMPRVPENPHGECQAEHDEERRRAGYCGEPVHPALAPVTGGAGRSR